MHDTIDHPNLQAALRCGATLYCPESFDPETLPEQHKHYRDHLVYMAHIIICRRIMDRRNRGGNSQDGFVGLKALHLRSMLGRQRYQAVIKAAIEIGLVESDNHYIVRRKCTGYRLGPTHRGKRWRKVRIRNEWLIRNRETWRLKQKEKITEYVHQHLRDWLERVEIDVPDDVYEGLKDEYQLMVDFVRDKYFFFTVDNYGRVHTNVVNLAHRTAKLRQYLRFGGKSLVNIDIANSQPLFLGVLVRKELDSSAMLSSDGELAHTTQNSFFSIHQPSIPTPTPTSPFSPYDGRKDYRTGKHDLDFYLELVQDGTLYQFLQEHAGYAHLDRNDFKHEKFFLFLYGSSRASKRLYRTMRQFFPTVVDHIDQAKAKGQIIEPRTKKNGEVYHFDRSHAMLPRKIQRMESDFVIKTVCGRLMREYPHVFIATIHDSILTTPEHVETVRGVMMEEFEAIGVCPQLKIEDYNVLNAACGCAR